MCINGELQIPTVELHLEIYAGRRLAQDKCEVHEDGMFHNHEFVQLLCGLHTNMNMVCFVCYPCVECSVVFLTNYHAYLEKSSLKYKYCRTCLSIIPYRDVLPFYVASLLLLVNCSGRNNRIWRYLETCNRSIYSFEGVYNHG